MNNLDFKASFKNLIELTEHLNTEQKCIDYFAKVRWGDSPCCPHCGCKKIYCFSDKKRYKCAKCRKIFNVKTDTIFENSKISLRKWFIAMYLMSSHKKGISSYQLAKDISVTQNTALFMLHRIRYACVQANIEIRLDNDVEVDETYVGGKNKNRHFNKKVKHSQGRSIIDKAPVFGLLERGGLVIARVVTDVSGATLKRIIRETVKNTARIMSDEYYGYNGLEKIYEHKVVIHGAKQYVIGEAHTNTMEGFWSHLKRAIFGIYHHVSRKYLQFYVDEIVYKYNTRKMKESERFNNLLSLCGVRLTYHNLVYG